MTNEQLELPLDLPPVAPKQADVVTAFVVKLHHDGSIEATGELNSTFTVEREAHFGDLRAGALAVAADVNNALVAQRVQAGIQAAAHAALEEQASAKIRANLEKRGITLPRS